ncbi:hypothetical protein [Nocardioides lianchengensis]|uniref:Uncharacterized protein n=1 Tax=Nocardioides lianchengensis TaxID=1045774 RepID=A0A1G6JRM9_9ACTN|nr:hypothetical protein [Nocardioides lianchengensis]NYG08756.1 hypothetical protein [Nocardioides lianchengensis]SDC21402.1 hypothetical protein SAMN05421872_101562 [Nocardioides lianchengensis]
MVAHDRLGDASYDGGIALGVDALAAHQLPDVLVELVDHHSVGVRGGVGHRHDGSLTTENGVLP